MSTVRTTGALPKISRPETSQSVIFYERMPVGEGIWNSKSIKLFGNHWAFRIVVKNNGVDFRIKFEGPEEVFQVEEIVITVGKANIPKYETVSEDAEVRVFNEISFEKYEARIMRNLCSVTKFKDLVNSHNILRFSITLTTKLKAKKSVVQVDDAQIYKLETELAQVTHQRNTIHKSLHKLNLSASQQSLLTESNTTQPEVIKAYDSFKQASRTVIFQLLAIKKPKEFGEVLIDFVKRLKRRLRARRKEKYHQIANALNIDKDNEDIQDVFDDAFKSILRSTGHNNIDNISIEDLKEIEKLIDTCVLAELEEERDQVIKFAKFIWGLINYMHGNNELFVNWEEFGMFVKFERGKFSSITRRVRAGEECFVVIPRLQRKPYAGNTRKVKVNDYEALCLGLVVPT